MIFNQDALSLKTQYLDGILAFQDLLQDTANDLAGGDVQLKLIPRPWQPGGGSTLFEVRLRDEKFFLKVKSEKVLVESKLESEVEFSKKTGLAAEKEVVDFIRGHGVGWVPATAKYVRKNGFDFLLFEYLDDFNEVASSYQIKDWIESFGKITEAVKWLFDHGIVHTDIHEHNLRIRSATGELVLVDFEESKFIRQDIGFVESLDYAGHNQYGNVGEVPVTEEKILGYSCLERLHRVYCHRIFPLLNDLIKRCNFDSSCPFLSSLDHGIDPRIYQSLNIPGLRVEGQRPLMDPRPDQILSIVDEFFDSPVVHVDIGSNIGAFNLALSRSDKVRRTVGVEAFSNYVDLANVQAFFHNVDKASFFCAECGEASLADLVCESVDIITIYSVYHHIRNKHKFLEDLIRLSPKVVLLELATQPECYDGRSWQEALAEIKQILGLPFVELLGSSADYRRPIVLLSSVSRKSAHRAEKESESGSVMPSGSFGKNKKVSIVLPSFNHVDFLPKAVSGLLQQTFDNFELIIINDGSTDATADYLVTITDSRVKVITQENRGLPASLNRGFAEASGEYFTWISADNFTGPAWLEQLVAGLDAAPASVGFVYSGFAVIDASGAMMAIRRSQKMQLDSLIAKNPGMASFLYRATVARKIGVYDEALTGAEDWDMWLRILEVCDAKYLDEVQYFYRVHGNSMTSSIPDKVLNASRATLHKLRLRHGNAFDLNKIYPHLRFAPNQPLAQWQAHARLGALLIESPFCPYEWAVDLLVAALRLLYTLQVHKNLIVLLCRNRGWDLALFSIDQFREHYPSQDLDNLRSLVKAHSPVVLDQIAISHIPDSDLVFELGHNI